MKRVVISSLVALMVGVSTQVWAQQSGSGIPTSQPTTRKLEIDLSTAVIYDTDVTRSSAAIAALRGLKRNDEIFDPNGSLRFVMPISREAIFLNVSGGYQFYRTNRLLNRAHVDVSGGLMARLAICRATITGRYDRAESNLGNLAISTRSNVVNNENVGLEGSCGKPYGLGTTFGVSQDWHTNSAPQESQADSRTLSSHFGVAYNRPTFGSLTLFGQYATTDFPSRTTLPGLPPISNGYENYSAGVSFDRHLGARIEASASVSYTVVKPSLKIIPGTKSFTYSFDATYRLSSRLDTHGSFSRSTTPSSRIDSTYSIDERYLTEVNYKLGSRLSFHLGGSWLSQHFQGRVGPAPLTLQSDRTFYVYGVADFQLSPRWSLSLDARQEQRDANPVIFSYSGPRVGLTAKASF